MAQRRMFSKKITDTDAFLDMPLEAQCLYFHINMHADDDGFNDAVKKIMRSIGASDDSLKILLAKRFLLSFDNTVYVVKHWLIHNYIAKDRYNPTTYTDLLNQLDVKENKAYTEIVLTEALPPESTVTVPNLPMSTECIQYDDTGKVRLGKVSIDKESIDKVYASYPTKCPVSKRTTGKSTKDKTKIGKLIKEFSEDYLITLINNYIMDCKKTNTYVKNFSTFLNNLPDPEQYTSNKAVGCPTVDSLVRQSAISQIMRIPMDERGDYLSNLTREEVEYMMKNGLLYQSDYDKWEKESE